MAAVQVRLPVLLARLGDGRREVTVEAEDVRSALDALFSEMPQLKVHIIDERGAMRRHVNCFLNDRSARSVEAMQAPVEDGDVVTVLQAVSGG